jgi:hypothetical protein
MTEKLDAAFQALEEAQRSLDSYHRLTATPSSSLSTLRTLINKQEPSPTTVLPVTRGTGGVNEKETDDIDGETSATRMPVKQVDRSKMNERQAAVVEAIDYAWNAYRSHAWGK